jgi:membrane-bound ClpP family serine protease
MTPFGLLLLLIGIGIAMLVAELLLPTHGILGVIGLIALAAAIGVCFWISEMVGLIVLIGSVVVSPFAVNLAMKIWERSPVGRRMILQPVDSTVLPAGVRIGQIGVAMSELRPMGEV